MNKKALLVVSFGTSHEDTRAKTIDRLEAALADAFPDRGLYHAWTSEMIIRSIRKKGIHRNTLEEAIAEMKEDGVTDVLVQPTHILNGVENDRMIGVLRKEIGSFETIACGTPLLTTEDDNEAVVRMLADRFVLTEADTAVIFMGHGTGHYVNPVYAALDYRFKDLGYENFFVATVEAYPSLDNVISLLSDRPDIRRVVLTPLMIVAGDHAKNDMAGEDEDSWKSRLEKEGYTVSCVIKGIGEYEETGTLLAEHAKAAERLSENGEETK